LAKEKGIEVEWKAFELRPEGVEVPPKSPEYMEQVRAGIDSLSKQYGLEMKLNTKSEHSRHALEGAKFAKEHGKENDYHDAVFSAYFQKNQDINDPDVLIRISKDIGLDQNQFRRALEDRTYEEMVLEDVQEAQQLGVTGIPCFISGGRGVMGAQTYESLLELVESE
jgi:predicted DsbA family dithiol-disulfide isomerase